ncbi:MAG: FHA domain-containing protein [Candidatus Binataceae bacterium]
MAAGPERKSGAPRLVAAGNWAGPRELPLVARKTKIGSASDNHIVLAEKTVSRHHAVIERRRRGFEVADLESTNGTYINGKRVANPVRLVRGDDVRFGQARFTFMAGTAGGRARGLGLRVAIPLMILLFVAAFAATRRWLLTHASATRGESPAAVTPAPAAPSPSPSISVRAIPAPASGARVAAAASSATSMLSPVPTPWPTPSGPQPEWLRRLNAYRAMAKLSPVVEDATLSAGDSAHVNYLIQNIGPALRAGRNPGIDAHLESADKPGYSAAGANAGKSSDVDFIAFGGMKLKDPIGWALVDWISGAFHRLPLLSPRLHRVGFKQVCGSGLCVAALDAQSGVEKSLAGTTYAAPIEFPADGALIALRTFTTEWPDPLTACAGYTAPTGLPITLATGYWMHATLDAYTLERVSSGGAATKLDACGFDGTTYTNPDPVTQQTARQVLLGQGTVVVIPLAPLTAGATYRISMTASGKRYQWTFSIAR